MVGLKIQNYIINREGIIYMLKQKIIAQYDGGDVGAKFDFFIEKAQLDEVNPDSYTITGVASTTNIDHDKERMSDSALVRMAKIINEKTVPLRVEHQKSDNAIIGQVDKAWLDERNKLWINATLNKENPAAIMLHNALKSGAKLGLSVGGRVKRAARELSEGAGKMIKTFYDVILDEVSVTPRPSNYDAWLIAKHYKDDGEEINKYYGTDIENEFLFENPRLDYLMAIEKSIPSQEWKKVEPENSNNINNDMKIFGKEKEDIKPIETETVETKFAEDDKKEDTPATKSYVDSKFAEIADMLKSIKKDMAVTVDATDDKRETTAGNSGVEKPLIESNPVKNTDENPAQVRTVKTGADGGDVSAEEVNPSAKDKTNPDEIKDENPAQERDVKSMVKSAMAEFFAEMTKSSSSTSSSTTKESSETSSPSTSETTETSDTSESTETETETDKDESTSSGSSDKKHDNGDYMLPELNRAMKSISGIDAFSAVVSDSIELMEKRITDKGIRMVGLRQQIADMIRTDPEIQKSIRGWMKEPGIKKSVVVGSPYVFMKDGTRLKLIDEGSYVQKSVNTKAKFGDVYKASFSSKQD